MLKKMSTPEDKLAFLRAGAETKRFHTWPVTSHQTVGAHSFGVAMLAWWLADGQPSTALLMAALTHDLAEHVTGDLPSPAKRALGIDFRNAWNEAEVRHLDKVDMDYERTLTVTEKRWLAVADMADGALYCIRERAMGNKLIDKVYDNFRAYMAEIAHDDSSVELLRYVAAEWEKACG